MTTATTATIPLAPDADTDGDGDAVSIVEAKRTDTHTVLVSGGRDSTAAAHAAVRYGPADLLLYLDTGTGLTANREYVETLADYLGVQLWTLRTPESYRDLVLEHGFPGPSRHFLFYQKLKERQLCKLAAVAGGSLHLWTGIRRLESARRLRHVEPEGERGDGRWYWHAPLCEWPDSRVTDYIEQFDLPENDLWSILGRSGDCYCGCYGSPEEKLDLRAAGCDDHADWLNALEADVEVDGPEKERERWAWGALSDAEQKAERAKRDSQQVTLCSTCDAPSAPEYPVTDGGDSDADSTDDTPTDEDG